MAAAEERSFTIRRRLSNNAVVCTDARGRELVALGRGVGHGHETPVLPVSQVSHTFYGIDPKYLSLIEELDPEVLEFSAQLAIVVQNHLSSELSPNLPLTLADHIAFAIKRQREHMQVTMPLSYDVQANYPVEYHLGELAVRGVNRTFGVRLPQSEAVGIALSIVNSYVRSSSRRVRQERTTGLLIDRATSLVEEGFGIQVDRGSFDYSRFATHVRYLIDRLLGGSALGGPSSELYETLLEQYPDVAACAEDVATLLLERLGATATGELTHDEKAYLALHIHRLRDRARGGSAVR